MNWKPWLYGLGAAFIGGGASAVSAGVSGAMIEPDRLNLGSGLPHLVELMVFTFLVSGALSAFAYLKQSPLPTELTVTKTETQVNTSTISVKPTEPQP